jgi:hypothetical protein
MSQSQAILDFLEKWNIDLKKTRKIPMSEKWAYGDEPATEDPERIKEFQSKVGSLNYFTQLTCPDIAFAVGILCRHLQNPNEQCFIAVQHLMSYLAGTMDLGIRYTSSDSSDLRLEAYCDANWGSDSTYKGRSTSGSVIYFGGGPIDWNSSIQKVVANSSAESEHISAFQASRNVVYYRQFLEEFGHKQGAPTTVHSDNTSAIAQSKNPIKNKHNKHMLLKYHYLRDLVSDQHVRLQFIRTVDQIADINTKPLVKQLFLQLRPFLVRSCSSSSTSAFSSLPSSS